MAPDAPDRVSEMMDTPPILILSMTLKASHISGAFFRSDGE